MTTDELIARFEDCTLPADRFDHGAHVQVAWGYLRRHAMPQALQRFTESLQRFAAHLGASDKYHATITGAYVFLINERLDGEARDLSWEDFAARHPELLSWTPSILERYYHPETLKSDRAKRTFVMPDRVQSA